MKRLAAQSKCAVQRLAEIEASITSLGDEDILDLADIFKSVPDSLLSQIAQVAMIKRGISL